MPIVPLSQSLFLQSVVSMVSLDLSRHLNIYSKDQSSYKCKSIANSHGRQNVRTSQRRLLAVNRVEVNRGAGDEEVTCLSFGRASSLAVVVILLFEFVGDISSFCIIMGAIASTVSAANECRHETLLMQTQREMLQQSMRERSDTLMVALQELRQAENDLLRTVRPTLQAINQDNATSWESCGSAPQENN